MTMRAAERPEEERDHQAKPGDDAGRGAAEEERDHQAKPGDDAGRGAARGGTGPSGQAR
ncbi:hypothetical protein [Mycobacterium lacus]|uniref:hypothetical protein n=1 Tax=Mycobacterium lacus TaxID=169765 RepID=UPI0013D8CA5C|nr:hypothetical protein [Mycobacterium lacus]